MCPFAMRLAASLILAAHCASSLHMRAGIVPVGTPVRAAVTMGRAEKRAAKRRAKKGGAPPAQVGGGGGGTPRNADDTVSRSTVELRLGEIPVFGILAEGKGFAVQGGESLFFCDAREAERHCDANPGYRVEGVPLDTVYFDSTTRLKAADESVGDAAKVPSERALVPNVNVPLFCIDGFQTTAKDTGVSSLPMFFSRAELLDFATPVYGSAEAEKKVLVTDLAVVVDNMLRGPAGLLRNARFFADAKALQAMDDLTVRGNAGGAQSLFPVEGIKGIVDVEPVMPDDPPEAPSAPLFPFPGAGGGGGSSGGGGGNPLFPSD